MPLRIETIGPFIILSSAPETVEPTTAQDLSLSIISGDTPVPTASLTAGTITITRVRAGAETVIVNASACSTAIGRIYFNYTFPAASWAAGDEWKAVFSGQKVTAEPVTYSLSDTRMKGRISREADAATAISEFHDDHGEPIAPDASTSDSLHNIKHKDASHTFDPTSDSNEAISDALTEFHDDHGEPIAPDTSTSDSLHNIKHKSVAHTFDPAADSLEALRDQLDTVPASGGVVNWNATALQAIQDEAEDALEGENLDHLQAAACADIVDPVDMTAEVVDNSVLANVLTKEGDTSDYDRRTDSLEAIADALLAGFGSDLVLHTVFSSGNLTNAGVATVMALDALGKTCKDIRVVIAISGATAGAGLTPTWYISDRGATATLDQVDPDARAQHALAGARSEKFDWGDLPEDCLLELRIASAGDDSALTYQVVVTYLQ